MDGPLEVPIWYVLELSSELLCSLESKLEQELWKVKFENKFIIKQIEDSNFDLS